MGAAMTDSEVLSLVLCLVAFLLVLGILGTAHQHAETRRRTRMDR